MFRWLAHYAVTCAVATSALVIVFIGGFCVGNWAGPGANTAAAQNYAHGLQAQWEAETETKLGDAQLSCATTATALKGQIASLQAQMATNAQTAAAQLKEATALANSRQRDALLEDSERILGLEAQLAAHHIEEIIVPARGPQ